MSINLNNFKIPNEYYINHYSVNCSVNGRHYNNYEYVGERHDCFKHKPLMNSSVIERDLREFLVKKQKESEDVWRIMGMYQDVIPVLEITYFSIKEIREVEYYLKDSPTI